MAFVQVTLSTTTSEALDAFNAAVRGAREIEACHMIAGGFDYLLKVRVKDVAAYRKALSETVSNLPYVAQTSTFMAMEIVKEVVGSDINLAPKRAGLRQLTFLQPGCLENDKNWLEQLHTFSHLSLKYPVPPHDIGAIAKQHAGARSIDRALRVCWKSRT